MAARPLLHVFRDGMAGGRAPDPRDRSYRCRHKISVYPQRRSMFAAAGTILMSSKPP